MSIRTLRPRVALAAGLCLLAALGGCRQAPMQGVAPVTLDSFDRFDGVWLRNDHLEVFLAAKPLVRIAAMRRVGGSSLLRLGDNQFVGLRTAYLEPVANDHSYSPCSQPGRIELVNPHHARAIADEADDASLRLTVDVELDADRPLLIVRHTMTNTADRTRRIALWSIIAMPRQGLALVPFGSDARPLRTVTDVPWAKPDQPCVTFGQRALSVDLAGQMNGNLMKIGVTNDTGYVAALRGRDLLVSRVPYQPDQHYPEGGANITVFQMENDAPWSEIEQVGPLTTVKPGASITMAETITLLELSAAPVAQTPPDQLRRIIEAAMPAE